MATKATNAFAVVLMKCRPGDENGIRQVVHDERKSRGQRREFRLCLRADAQHECVRDKVNVISAAYCFGPFDFLFVVRSREVHFIERFVVECIRGDGSRIEDTHTIIGITI
jgi:hypothetical protein